MKNTKHKILVLSDLTDQSINVVKSASNIAQLIDGKINLFHVRKPTKVVAKESTLSAVRELKDHYVLADKKLKSISNSVSENASLPVNYSFSFGNLKREIEKHIQKTKPDIIVLGKRTSKIPNFFGDDIFSFLMKKFDVPVLLASNDAVIDEKSKLSLGLYNNTDVVTDSPFVSSIISSTDGTIKSFSVGDKNTETIEKQKMKNNKVVSYIFEKNDQILKNMSNYIQKNKVNLLIVDRKSKSANSKEDLSISALNSLAETIKVPLLFSN